MFLINTEDFSAAVDFLGLQPSVNLNRIGMIGICGWSAMALNAAAVYKRIKAVATSTMYDTSRVMVAYNKAEEHIKVETDLSRMAMFTEELKRIDLTGAPMETRRALNGIIIVAEEFQKVLREHGNTNSFQRTIILLPTATAIPMTSR